MSSLQGTIPYHIIMYKIFLLSAVAVIHVQHSYHIIPSCQDARSKVMQSITLHGMHSNA